MHLKPRRTPAAALWLPASLTRGYTMTKAKEQKTKKAVAKPATMKKLGFIYGVLLQTLNGQLDPEEGLDRITAVCSVGRG